MKKILVTLFVLLLMPYYAAGADYKSLIVYYSKTDPIKSFYDYDLIVFDSKIHPPLRGLSDRNKTLLGYLSIAEIDKNKHFFQEQQKAGAVLEPHPEWQGSYYIDLGNRQWIELVINELIPEILRQGFHGIFIDTANNASELERKNPKKYKGMKKSAVKLIKAIRLHYPYTKIMVNGGYDLIPEISGSIDMLLAEELYSKYDFTTNTYKKKSAASYKKQLKKLKQIQKSYPKLQIFTLDYWDKKDTATIKEIYQLQQQNNFIPYVGEVLLDSVVKVTTGE